MSKIKHNVVQEKNTKEMSIDASKTPANSAKKQDGLLKMSLMLWVGPLVLFTIISVLKECSVI